MIELVLFNCYFGFRLINQLYDSRDQIYDLVSFMRELDCFWITSCVAGFEVYKKSDEVCNAYSRMLSIHFRNKTLYILFGVVLFNSE